MSLFSIETRIISHPSRGVHLRELLECLDAPQVFIDDHSYGAKWNHLQALRTPTQPSTSHILIIEDDATPVNNFYGKVAEAIEQYPHMLISLYLGSGRPTSWQGKIEAELASTSGGFIMLPKLITGVCYVLPAEFLPAFSKGRMNSTPQADFSIGEAFLEYTQQQGVMYPKRSLVQHKDILPVKNDGRIYIERKARELNND